MILTNIKHFCYDCISNINGDDRQHNLRMRKLNLKYIANIK